MKLNYPFSENDMIRAGEAQVTAHMLADAAFEGIRATYIFHKVSLLPLLQGFLNKNPREQAIMALHYRIAAYLTSLYKLNDPLHFQTIAASARSLFELGLDMELFGKDSTAESLNRLNAFVSVERYRTAGKLVDFYSTKPVPQDRDLSKQRSLCADLKEKRHVEELNKKYWGHRNSKGDLLWPKHWSRFQETRGRARHVKGAWEEWYVWNYYMLSWHVHSGLTGTSNVPREAFDYFAAEAFQLSTDVLVEVYKILGREFHLDKAMDKWVESLTFLGQVIAMSLFDKCLQSLGEPHRFQYLEEHEKGVA